MRLIRTDTPLLHIVLLAEDYVAGIDTAPLPSACEYDCPCALLYTAEQDAWARRIQHLLYISS